MQESQHHWGNLGFWLPTTKGYCDAARGLAARLGEAARLGPEDRVLLVGFGYGEEIGFFRENFGVKEIYGVEKDPKRVAAAQKKWQGVAGVRLYRGEGVFLQLEGFFDKILVLDAAYHFRQKKAFFLYCQKLLKKDGLLCLNDLLLEKESKSLSLRCLSPLMSIPLLNWQTLHSYKKDLLKAGLYLAQVEDQTKNVLEGFAGFMAQNSSQRRDFAMTHGQLKPYATKNAILRLRKSDGIRYAMMVIKKAF